MTTPREPTFGDIKAELIAELRRPEDVARRAVGWLWWTVLRRVEPPMDVPFLYGCPWHRPPNQPSYHHWVVRGWREGPADRRERFVVQLREIAGWLERYADEIEARPRPRPRLVSEHGEEAR